MMMKYFSKTSRIAMTLTMKHLGLLIDIEIRLESQMVQFIALLTTNIKTLSALLIVRRKKNFHYVNPKTKT
tara:strand:+ start:451 stop:663 length:213 start_codon:yes stop_codon:yes gene_type:complete